jgi:tetratricopeptide (TPR) repeat protein
MRSIIFGIGAMVLVISSGSAVASKPRPMVIFGQPASLIIAATPSLTEDELFNRAYKKAEDGDLAGAIADYTEVIKINPKNANAYNNRGNARSKYNKPRPISSKPINAGDTAGTTVGNLPEVGDPAGAIEDYTKAISINPKDALFYQNRAIAYERLRKYKEAIADYSQAILISPNNPDLYFGRGYVYSLLYDTSNSRRDYQSGEAKMKPTTSSEYAARGWIRNYKLQEYSGAISDYTKAIELNPGNGELYARRASIYVEIKKDQLAIADYTKAILLSNEDDVRNNYFERGQIYYRLDDYQKAIADFNRAYSASDECISGYAADICQNRGIAKLESGDIRGALVDFERLIKQGYTSPETYYYRGLAKQNLGNQEGAKQDYQAILNAAETYYSSYDKYNLYYYQGLAYFGLGKTQSAIANFTEAIKLDPINPLAYHHRGIAYQVLKDKINAINDLKKADRLYLQQNKLNKHRIVIQLLSKI